jgi:hypothetical protein
MKELTVIIFTILLAAACVADQKDDAKWWRAPQTNAIPLDTVDLVLVSDPGIGVRVPRPLRGNLVFRFRNAGKQVIDSYDAHSLFFFGTVFLTPPEGTNLAVHIPTSFMGSFRGTPLSKIRDISPGDQMEFITNQPAYRWFPSMTNSMDGIYKVWWQIDQKKSNSILFRKEKGKIEPIEEETSQQNAAPLSTVPQPGPSEGAR